MALVPFGEGKNPLSAEEDKMLAEVKQDILVFYSDLCHKTKNSDVQIQKRPITKVYRCKGLRNCYVRMFFIDQVQVNVIEGHFNIRHNAYISLGRLPRPEEYLTVTSFDASDWHPLREMFERLGFEEEGEEWKKGY